MVFAPNNTSNCDHHSGCLVVFPFNLSTIWTISDGCSVIKVPYFLHPISITALLTRSPCQKIRDWWLAMIKVSRVLLQIPFCDILFCTWNWFFFVINLVVKVRFWCYWIVNSMSHNTTKIVKWVGSSVCCSSHIKHSDWVSVVYLRSTVKI